MTNAIAGLGQASDVPQGRCPVCGHLFEAASGVHNSRVPEPGDVSICIECAAIGVFTETLALRSPTAAEAATFLCDPLILEAIAAVASVQSKGRPQ